MTLAEWGQLPDDVRGELIDGALVEEEMASNAHELVVFWLAARLYPWARKRGGFAFGSNHKLGLSPRVGRKPDLAVYVGAGAPLDPHASMSTRAPTIAIEVITPRPRDTKRDRVEKPDEYARFGVRWYWLVDPTMRTIEVLELGARKRYARAASASDGKLRPPGCPGLVLDLDDLWRDVEALER